MPDHTTDKDKKRWIDRDRVLPVPLPVRRQRGCLPATMILLLSIFAAFTTWFWTLVTGCTLEFRKPPGAVVQPLGGDLQLGSAMRFNPERPFSQHVRDRDGNLTNSFSAGPGFRIDWKSPRVPDGATLEQVLDVALSRMQAVNSSPQATPELAQHLYALDRLVNDMRGSSFRESTPGAPRSGSATGPGFVVPPASPGASENDQR